MQFSLTVQLCLVIQLSGRRLPGRDPPVCVHQERTRPAPERARGRAAVFGLMAS